MLYIQGVYLTGVNMAGGMLNRRIYSYFLISHTQIKIFRRESDIRVDPQLAPLILTIGKSRRL